MDEEPKVYTRSETQKWRDDIAIACAEMVKQRLPENTLLIQDLMNLARYPLVVKDQPDPATKFVRYEYTVWNDENTVTHGWQPWKECSETEYLDLLEYIKSGHKYRTRELYTIDDGFDDGMANCPKCGTKHGEYHLHGCVPAGRYEYRGPWPAPLTDIKA